MSSRRERQSTLRVHIDADPVHLNPMLSPTLWGRHIGRDTVFETLLTLRGGDDPAAPGRYEPGLARRWTVAPGGREIRIDLQPDVTFHDGRRMTSVDVQFSLDAARSPRWDAPHLRAALDDITAVELITARAVRIRLARPSGYALRALAEVPIVPQHVYAPIRRASRGPVVGTGPYRFASWEGDEVRLEAYAGYWGKRPAIPTIVFHHDPDAARALTAAKAGDIDVVPALAPVHYPEQAEAPGVAARFRPLRLRPPTLRYLALNAARRPFDDARVRAAVSLSLDRETIVQRAHDGLAWAPTGPVWPGGPVHGPGAPAPVRDPMQAGLLLDAAGWTDANGDGVREQGSRRLMITVLSTPDDSPERDLVLGALRKAGFTLDVRTGSPAVLANRLAAHDFDLAFVEWTGDVDRDPSSLFATGGRRNYGGFSHPDVDRVLASLRAAADPAERAPHARELARLVAAEHPIVPLTAPDPYGLIGSRVRGATVRDGWIALRELELLPDGEPRE